MSSRRGRNHERMRRAAEHRIDDIEFGAGRAAANETEITKLFVVGDALECP